MERVIADTSRDPVVWNEEVENNLRLQYAVDLFRESKNNEGVQQMMMAIAACPTRQSLILWASVLRQVNAPQLADRVDVIYNQLYTQSGGEPVVAIYTGASGFYTGADMSGPGVWGSELAAVNLAEALKMPVFVFCECLQFDKPPYPHNGVTYLPHQFYGAWSATRAKRSIYLIVSRYLYFFVRFDVLAAKAVFFWVHDKVPNYLTVGGGSPLPEQGRPLFRTLCATNVITQVICVSKWQADGIMELSGKMPVIIGNAVPPILKMMPNLLVPQVPGRMIFCSDPTRGLERLLKLFPRIKEKAPWAELHVYWSSFEGYNAPDGVTFKNKVLQTELFVAMQQAQVLLYPNHGHETYCQVALEASLAGCHVIARDYSGIADVLRSLHCGTLIPGELDEAWETAAVDKTLEVFALQQPVVPLAIPTWSDRASEWKQLFL